MTATDPHECPTCGGECIACTPENAAQVSHTCEDCGDEWYTNPAEYSPDTLRYAPFCRKGPHMPVSHHRATLQRHPCDCPCHLGNAGASWWSDVGGATNG